MTFDIRRATPRDDGLIAEYFGRMWAEYDLDEILTDDWREKTLSFIERAREGLKYAAFIAELDDEAVGCTACQVFSGLYPSVFHPDKRKYGYIWGVYVTPQARGRGVAKGLTNACIDYLKSVGCTRVHLHASPMGRPVYEKLEFKSSNEMYLDLL